MGASSGKRPLLTQLGSCWFITRQQSSAPTTKDALIIGGSGVPLGEGRLTRGVGAGFWPFGPVPGGLAGFRAGYRLAVTR